MSLFKKNVVYVGIYSIYDPVVKDRSCKFSLPFSQFLTISPVKPFVRL